MAKQRELSGNLESESEAKLKKQISNAKSKELSGHDIFAPPPEIQPRPLAARAPALRESITIGETAARNVSAFVEVCMATHYNYTLLLLLPRSTCTIILSIHEKSRPVIGLLQFIGCTNT